MCGITGIWNLDRKPLRENDLRTYNNTLSHRGPDGSSIYINTHISLGLGHNRLSILDLSNLGTQPMSYLNGRYTIVFNGEIFNFIEIKKELLKKGYTFKSNTDTEVILAAYDAWGKECLQKFNGMWAFVIYDDQSQELFIARDRFGIKPLYYFYIPGKIFAFASETKAFKHLPGYARSYDQALLKQAVQKPFSLEGYGYTIYKNINALCPGHYIYVNRASLKINQKRWWSTLQHTIDLPNAYEDRVTYFRDTFKDACNIRLRSDVPIGTALSGGVDSTAVYSMVHHLMKGAHDDTRIPSNWQKAFVASFPGTSLDERTYAETAIQNIGGTAEYITPTEETMMSTLLDTTIAFDNIYVSPLFVVSNIYKGMRQNGVKVSLDGHGADEMLMGYSSLIKTAYKDLTHRKSNDELKEMFGEYIDEMDLTSLSKNKSIMPEKILVYGRTLRNRLGIRNFGELPYLGESESGYNKMTLSERDLFTAFHRTTLPTILRNFDHASMQHGVEVRMPFMDWRLVTLAFSLPLEDKINHGFSKRILRDSMVNIMPETIRKRRSKIGLNAPMIEWFYGPMKTFLFDSVSSESFLSSPLWNGRLIRDTIINAIETKTLTWAQCVKLWPYINAHILLTNTKI